MEKINQPPETLRDLKPDSKLICTGSGALPACAAKMFRELTQVTPLRRLTSETLRMTLGR